MNEQKEALTVVIGGQKFDILTSDNRDLVRAAAASADEKVTGFIKKGVPATKAVALALLEFATDYKKQESEIPEYREKISEYLVFAEEAKLRAAKLERENTTLRNKLKKYQ